MTRKKPCCSQCEGIEQTFNEEAADEDLRFYRAEGLDETTEWLVDEIKAQGVNGATLLDIGGGVGMIQHELLKGGAASAVHVDASSAYIEAAQREAKRRRLREKIEWRHGNFVDIAKELSPADVVTLDKVICCYDDMPSLVKSSAKLARRFYGIVTPRDTWYFRFGAKFMNMWQALFRNPYRMFVHPIEDIERHIKKAGLKRTFLKQDFMWRVAVYTRA
ncbi:MAG: methyltransferase domain-containing protein [Anaerolineales bacterium]